MEYKQDLHHFFLNRINLLGFISNLWEIGLNAITALQSSRVSACLILHEGYFGAISWLNYQSDPLPFSWFQCPASNFVQ